MRTKVTTLLLGFLLGCSFSLSAVDYCSTSAFGYGASATGGGGSATPVLVSSVSELSSALNKGKNKVIIITKSLTFTKMLSVQDGSNVTLLGLPGVTLTSLEQTSSTSGILYVKRFNNLIIRNLTFVGPGAYDEDGNDLLCFESVTNAWVDHCDFQDGMDGNFDNKKLSDNVTISWCRFRYLKAPKPGGSGGADDHRFTNLLGSTASDKPSDGTFNYTWAYCWWDEGCKERMVRCRNCELHFLNCYWNSSVANYYVGPENAKCYFDGCTFEGKANTSSKIFKSYGGTNACKFVGCSGNLPSNSGTISAPSYSYASYTFANAAAAKTAITNASCGAGATLTVTTAGAISSTCDGGAAPTVYTVTWNATTNGGTCGTSTTLVTDGNAIGSLPEATRSGYTFDGWYTAPTGGTKISSSTVITKNETYYAQFTSAPVTTYYTIIWDANGGTCATASTSVESGKAISTAIATLPTATKSGDYSFDGWYTATSGGTKITTSTVVNANVTYYAHYTATGGSGGGSCTGTIYSFSVNGTALASVTQNTEIALVATYGTESGGTIYLGNKNSDAAKSQISDTKGIYFNGNDAYVKIVLDCPLAEGDVLTFGDGSGKQICITLTNTRSTTIVTTSYSYTIPAASSLIGQTVLYLWRADSGGTYFKTINITRSGSTPTPSNYFLYYDENGGSGTMAATEQTGANVTVTANAFTAPTGYAFQKWNTAMNGSGTDRAAGDVITLTEDLTLYAIWAPESYTVTLNAEGGAGGTENVTATFDEAMPSIAVPTKSGYVFSGYFTGTNGTGTQYYDGNGSSTNSWDIAANTELHAYWVEGSSSPTAGCDLHFWFFKEADATANSKTNDATVFSGMVANSTTKEGSITIDGNAYGVTGRTGDPDDGVFGSFTIPTGKTGTFYALAVSSGNGERQINLVGPSTYELTVPGGSDSYKRIESEELSAGTYSIERGSGNVRLGVVVVKICGAVSCDADPSAPSGLTAGSITSSGVTFTITDDATPTSYDIYYSTESTAPIASTEATTTTIDKTKIITGLTPGTTYYAWVRSVCDASHKSAWVALTGSTFATSKMVPTSYTVGASAEGECVGGMTAKITLSGSQSGIEYQLKKDGANDGAAKAGTGNALEWTGKGSGVYTIWTIENATYSALQMSGTATVVVYATTAITTQPATAVAAEINESFTLGTGMVTAGNELTYRWYTCGSTGADTVFISGATSATYSGSQSVADTYYYRVRVKGTCGDPVLSDVITVTVGTVLSPSDAPTISVQPVGATYCAGDAVSALSITASGSGTLSYQWKKDGVNIDGETSASYTPMESGTYTCVVTNEETGNAPTSVTSDEAEVTIKAAVAAPTFSQTDNTVTLSTATDGATIYYTTDGTDPTTSSASGTSYDLTSSCTIKAYAVKDGCSSAISTYSATWKLIVMYTVTYNANGGTVANPSQTQASEGASVTLETPTRDGYTFLGWYVGATKIGDGGDSYTPTADVTAIAAWKQDCVGGSEAATITIGNSSSSSYAASFTSSSTNANITANATVFTKGSSTTSGSSSYSSATAPYSIKFKPSSNINTDEWSDNYSVSVQFTVASSYTFAPNSISATIVTEAANYTYQAILTDGVTTYTSNDVSSSANGVSTFTFSSLSGTALSGTVTFKVRYKSTANNAKFFVINLPVTISGNIAAAGGGDCFFVTYDGNGADGGYTNDPKAYDADDEVTVLANGFTKSGTDVFKGWAASTANRDAGTVDYLPGATFTITGNTTLYAIWGTACIMPDAPTSPTNGITTQTTQNVSWTDTDNSQWEVYISVTNSTPDVNQTPTATLNTTTYTFTGLEASHTYYWWVRSVCDASHKSAWVAGPSFTTAAPTYTLTNEVSPAGYGTVSPASVTGIPSGTTTSSSNNTYTVNGTTVTATPADATAQYKYEFSSWSGLPASVTADATVTAIFTQLPQQYDITLHTNGGTINSGNVEHYLYGTGATLPTDVTKDGGAVFVGWYDNSSFSGSLVTEISASATGNKEYWAKWILCPEANSGDIVYKFVTKSSGLGTGNVCATASTYYDMTTANALSELVGGSLSAYATNTNRLKYAESAFTFANGEGGLLQIELDCPIASGDMLRYINSATSDGYNAYVRHTSSGTSDDQITLDPKHPTVTSIYIPAAFVGEKTLYLVRGGNNNAKISYFEIVRSCPLTLDAGTNGGTVEGNATKVVRAANGDVLSLPHAFKDGKSFKGWYTAASGGSSVSNPYTISGATTLYAQFEDCPHDGIMYKFEVGTGLTNGAVTENNVAFEFTTANYLTTLVGGILTTDGSKASKVMITGTNAININDNDAYLKVDMDCEIHAGDVFKSTVSTNTVYVSRATTRTKTVELPVGTLTQTPIPATLVGEKTLYIWKGNGSSNALQYFEITRPKQTEITLNATGAYNHYTPSVVAMYEQPMPEMGVVPLRTGYVFGGYYDEPNGAGTQYYNGLGVGVRNWDKDVYTATLYAHWIEPCDLAPKLTQIVPVVSIWDNKKVDLALVQLSCDFDATGINYSLVSASEAIPGCTFVYRDERIYIQGTPSLGNTNTETKTITFTMTNDCSPASTYTVTATIRIYPATRRAKIAYIITGSKGGAFNAWSTSDSTSSATLLAYLKGYYDVNCVNGYATKDAAAIASYYDQYDLLIVTDYMETPEGYTNAIGTLIDKKPILSFEAYVAGEHGSNWHIGSNPKDPSPKVQDMKILCAGHAIFKDAPGVDVINDADTTVHVLNSLSSAGDAKGLQGFVINEAPDYIFLATIKDANHNRDLIVCCERQVVFPARLLLYGINYYEMANLSDAGKVVMYQMIDYLLMTDETKVADCSLVFDNGAGNTTFDAGAYTGTGTKGDGKWSTAANWAPGYNIVPTPYHPTRIIAECHIDKDNAHAGSVKVNTGHDEHDNLVDGKLIVEPYGGLTVAGIVAKVNDTRYASPITIKAEDLLIKADATHNGAFVYGNKESDVRATVQYYSRGDAANTTTPVWQYMGIPFQANNTAINMYYEAWMCRWAEGTTDNLGGLWQWVDINDVLIPFEGYCITQGATKTYTNIGKLNAPVTTVISLDNRDQDGYAFAANSWTAPIKIQEMEDGDFTNAERAIYIFHSGTYASWNTNKETIINTDESNTVPAPGQYVVIPIHSSPYLGVDSVIPAMQGFFVKTITVDEDASLSLVYNRVVYDAKYFCTSTQPMRAPRIKTSAPEVMVINLVGDSYGDRIHILSRSDFSDAYEDGWDGRKIEGDAAAPKLAVVKESGEMAVAAVESADGRYLSFRAGEDSLYTFTFKYEGEELYLYDQLTQIATEIKTGNTYSFNATNKTAYNRFLITSNPPRVPTDIDNTDVEHTNDKVMKYLDEGNIYILRRGKIYDLVGKQVNPKQRKEAAQ